MSPLHANDGHIAFDVVYEDYVNTEWSCNHPYLPREAAHWLSRMACRCSSSAGRCALWAGAFLLCIFNWHNILQQVAHEGVVKDFHFPLFKILVHLTIIFCFSTLARCALQCWMGKLRVTLSRKVYISKVAPTAPTHHGMDYTRPLKVTCGFWHQDISSRSFKSSLATALDMGLSNWSFLFITISLYTMTKSSVVLFILFFSLVFKLEEPVYPVLSGGLHHGPLCLFYWRNPLDSHPSPNAES
ncbi:uncharacterized protein LOC127419077 isoform X3 [Myxocyprinus asiaticus]|uniref:uncharacterized protein LOC127419077 isoform X3 n=1 Tax=Myxocyprinus asiaticus TaxID=70543 RepID=UPI002223A8A8|nr:uncharacterized protein LOC127419077 isoform X3 [Myxocyprinus asiaticus]